MTVPTPISDLVSAARRPGVALVSTDVFDTVLLRDHSTETGRLAEGARRAAIQLGVEPDVLIRLRWWLQDDAYRAVAVGRPTGEARLAAICEVLATVLGLDPSAAALMHAAEVDVDIEHLRPNTELLAAFADLAARGVRVVAVSDTYYSTADLERMLRTLCGEHPIATVYASSDLGRTKHAGLIFDAVAEAEHVEPHEIVHVGDNHLADVERPTAAAWAAVHLPRTGTRGVRRMVGRARSLPAKVRRLR